MPDIKGYLANCFGGKKAFKKNFICVNVVGLNQIDSVQ